MQFLDWVLVVLPIMAVLGVALYTKRYVRSVADFLAGGRCAGRYLIANAKSESDSGLANSMSKFEMILVSGFVMSYWELLSVPALLLVGISGFVVYRFRETRALTLAQFFEQRYSRNFRLFMGVLAFISGILNYGIFPAVSARFFIYFLDLPHAVHLGSLAIPTMTLLMGGYLSFTLIMIIVGGQVSLMITDCIEGLFSHLVYIIIVIAMFLTITWPEIVSVMSAAPANHSQINPFDAESVKDFNVWYMVILILSNVYTTMALQNKQGFNAAARTAHESRMAGVLGNWRMYARTVMILVLGVCALTFIKHPDLAAQSAPARAEIAAIKDAYLQKQMTVPIALKYLLPTGVKGLFCVIMIMGLFAGDAGHMHSWGSIFVQDVLLPLRKKPLTPAQHMWALRLALAFVAGFAFFFSTVFPQTQYIALWWAITAGIFTGGAGAAIIGGLYWSRGTTRAAWAAAITGSVIAFTGILCNSVLWKSRFAPALGNLFNLTLPDKFWLNNQQSAFVAACCAAGTYITISLLQGQRFDLNKMLHREAAAPRAPRPFLQNLSVARLLKFDASFTFWDKLVAGGIFWWAMGMMLLNIVITTWNLAFHPWPIHWWANYWLITGIGLPMLISLTTFFWFGIGGIVDMRDFFRALKTMSRDTTDDGRVKIAPESLVLPTSAPNAALETAPTPTAPTDPRPINPPINPAVG